MCCGDASGYYAFKCVIASNHLKLLSGGCDPLLLMLSSHEYLSYFFIRLPEIVIAAAFSSIPPQFSPLPVSSIMGNQRRDSSHLDVVYNTNTSPTSQLSLFSIAALHRDT